MESPAVELAVIIPVYNEQECIVPVLEEWRSALQHVVKRFHTIVVDDGSTDETPTRLRQLAWSELTVHRHSNRGHGQSCLVGYQLAAASGAEYVFQIDSDGQCDPSAFRGIWARRCDAVAVYGRRVQRDDGLARKIITRILRHVLRWKCGTGLSDANVPYRLYQAGVAAEASKRVPPSFDLANIGLALLLEPLGFVEVPIHFRDRMGGHPSVKWWGFARKARRLMRDLGELPRA